MPEHKIVSGPVSSSSLGLLVDDDKIEEKVVPDVLDILPVNPEDQIFSGVVTHIDKNAVVWIVAEINRPILSRIANILASDKSGHIEEEIIPGNLLIGHNNSSKVRARVLEADGGYFKCIDVDKGEIFMCGKSKLFKIPKSLLQIPTLAIPLKDKS